MSVSTLFNAQAHARRTLALVLAGGRGTRLGALTDTRAKPAVPFGGKYRLIDFALSNCLNSNIGRVGILTQYQSHSLNQHVLQGWDMTAADGTPMIELLPAQQRSSESNWYMGTADAIYQNLDIVKKHNPEYVLVLAGDHIYKMDYAPLIEQHVRSDADMTISAVETSLDEGKSFGVLSIDDSGRVTRFTEKPNQPEAIPSKPEQCLSSMGVYVFNAQFLYRLLDKKEEKQIGDDFGHDIIPSLIKRHRVMAYSFSEHNGLCDYWRDVGTLDSFWQANLDLIGAEPQLELYDQDWPIRTLSKSAPPAKFNYDSSEICGAAVNALVCEGCVISGALVKNSVLCTGVSAGEKSYILDSVILPDCVIGKDCSLRRVVLDRNCVVPDGMVIGYDAVEDARHFQVTESHVVLVTQRMLDALEQPNETRRAA